MLIAMQKTYILTNRSKLDLNEWNIHVIKNLKYLKKLHMINVNEKDNCIKKNLDSD